MRAISLATLLASTSAVANPSVTLPRGTVSATVTTEINASADVMGSPSSIAPDLSFGLGDDLTVSLVHSSFATTGFRGSAGLGFCIADECLYRYNNVGLELTHALTRGRFASGVTLGVFENNVYQRWTSGKIGGRLRATIGDVVIASNPSMFFALSDRDGADMNRDRLFLPVSAMYRLAPSASLGVTTGFKAALDDVAGSYEIAAGALCQYTFSPMWSAGASWVHGKIIGGDAAVPAGTSGVDFRALQLWVTMTAN